MFGHSQGVSRRSGRVGKPIRTAVLTAAAALSLAAPAVAAGTYEIDLSHSSVGFSVRHLVISNVRGVFSDFSGTILYDEENIGNSSVEVVIKADSIDTGNEDRDNHLRNPDFFDTANHGAITFKSDSIRKKGNGYVAAGTLTIRGKSNRVEIPFEILGKINDPWGNTRIGISGGLSIDRQNFGVSWSKTMDAGGLMVGNEVPIELNVEAVLKK
jgi:polyisoprenoid-binding protein YceI